MNGACDMCNGPVDILHVFFNKETNQLICEPCYESLVRLVGEP